MQPNNNQANRITKALLIIYLLVLVWILLLKLGVQFSYMGERSVNLIPFSEFLSANGKVDLPEFILNIVIFVPLGIYTGLLYKDWTFLRKLLFFFIVSFLIEAVQYLLKAGAFDVTDLITNISGGLIGLLIFNAIEKLFNNSVRSQKFINIISAVGTFCIISLLLLLKLNMLPIKYQ